MMEWEGIPGFDRLPEWMISPRILDFPLTGERSIDDLVIMIDKSDNYIYGHNGTQVTSKTVWQSGKTERIDVENPAPGKRPGQIHYHDTKNNKWYYDSNEKVFYNQKTGDLAPKKIQRLLNESNIQKAIKKGLNILGEN